MNINMLIPYFFFFEFFLVEILSLGRQHSSLTSKVAKLDVNKLQFSKIICESDIENASNFCAKVSYNVTYFFTFSKVI